MIDRNRAGMRCRTVRFVRTVEGDLPKLSEGIIRYEIENLDRRLVLVDWDRGFTVPVFPHEVEFIACQEATTTRP
jgi:hypothetical protein